MKKRRKIKEIKMITGQVEEIEKGFTQGNSENLLKQIDKLQSSYWELQKDLEIKDKIMLKVLYKNDSMKTGLNVDYRTFTREEIMSDESLSGYQNMKTQIKWVENLMQERLEIIKMKIVLQDDDMIIEKMDGNCGEKQISVDFTTGEIEILGVEYEKFRYATLKMIENGIFKMRDEIQQQIEFLRDNLQNMLPSGKRAFIKKCLHRMEGCDNFITETTKTSIQRKIYENNRKIWDMMSDVVSGTNDISCLSQLYV